MTAKLISIEKQEKLIGADVKMIAEKKRKILAGDIKEAKDDIEKGKFITGNYEQVMKEIDDEVKSDNQNLEGLHFYSNQS